MLLTKAIVMSKGSTKAQKPDRTRVSMVRSRVVLALVQDPTCLGDNGNVSGSLIALCGP